MTDAAEAPRLAETFAEVEDALLSRWPETRLEPSLDRIRAFTELLGDPQRAYPVIHLTGTNGKTSTSRMIDTLLRALDLRTGRFTSPHVERMTERICIDGEPLTDEAFVRAFNDVAPYTHLVDAEPGPPAVVLRDRRRDGVRRVRRRPGRRRRRRGRHGRLVGRHQRRRRRRRGGAAGRGRPRAATSATRPPTSRSRRPGSSSPARSRSSPSRRPEVAEVLLAPRRRGRRHRASARAWSSASSRGCRRSAARWCRCRACAARYDDVFLPLYGAHQAQNAAVALAAVEAFAGDEPLDDELVRAAFAEVTSPGPAGDHPAQPDDRARRRAQPARRRGRGRGAGGLLHVLDPLIGVIGVMADKDDEGLLGGVRAAPGPRRLHAELHRPRDAGRGAGRGRRARSSARTGSPSRRRLADAIDQAAALAEAGEAFGDALGSGAVLVTGSVVTVGEARHDAAGPVVSEPSAPAAPRARSPRRGMCAAVLSLEAIILGLTTPVMVTHRRRAARHRAGRSGSASPSPACCSPGCCAASGPTALGWVVQVAAIGLGFVVPMMFVLGSIFALLWGTAYFLGRKIERERAAAYAAHRESAP